MVYSFSFALNAEWSCPFPQQPELLKYIQSVAKTFQVTQCFTLNRKTEKAEWSPERGQWRVSYVDLIPTDGPATKDSQKVPGSEGFFDCDFLFNTTHTTNEPGLPDIPGALEGTFEREWWHSMRWPKDGLERCRGKRVAMIGCAGGSPRELRGESRSDFGRG